MNKRKLVVFSWDDADLQDRRFVELYNRLGIKCTFNVNSENIGSLPNKFSAEEIVKVYAGHEVAGHTLTHPNLAFVEDDGEVVRQVEQDRINLQKLFGYTILGFAYPGDGRKYVDERVIGLIRERTGAQYARTGNSSHRFDPPEDFFEWNPTGHILMDDIESLAEEFFAIESGERKIFFLWGHSYEMADPELYRKFESFCERIAGRRDVEYVTSGVARDLILRDRAEKDYR